MCLPIKLSKLYTYVNRFNLICVFVTTTALLCQRVIVNKQMKMGTCTMQTSRCKSAPAQYKRYYYLVPPPSLSRKQTKTKLMLCKPLFIIYDRVKGLCKVILQDKNKVPQLQKWVWHMHIEIL